MSWLDAFFFGYSVQVLGVPFPHENVLNFTGAVVGTDDVANGRTTVNVTGGGGGGGITALTGDVTASGTGSVAATVAGIQGNPVCPRPHCRAAAHRELGATGSAWTTVSGDSTLSDRGDGQHCGARCDGAGRGEPDHRKRPPGVRGERVDVWGSESCWGAGYASPEP